MMLSKVQQRAPALSASRQAVAVRPAGVLPSEWLVAGVAGARGLHPSLGLPWPHDDHTASFSAVPSLTPSPPPLPVLPCAGLVRRSAIVVRAQQQQVSQSGAREQTRALGHCSHLCGPLLPEVASCC